MSELTNIHARAVKDLTTPTELPANPNALDQVKLVAGNFPSGFQAEALTVDQLIEVFKRAIQTPVNNLADVAYPTLAEALTHMANLPKGTIALITNDGANNGLYLSDGATLNKTEYDAIVLSDVFSDIETIMGVVNGAANTKAVSRLGRDYWTLATVDALIVSGLLKIDDLQDAIDIAAAAGAGANGWTASLVADASGKNQQQINNIANKKLSTTYDIDDVSNYDSRLLSDVFTTLADANLIYPFATDLTGSLGWAVLQKQMSELNTNTAAKKMIAGSYFVNKTLKYEAKATVEFDLKLELSGGVIGQYAIEFNNTDVSKLSGKIVLSCDVTDTHETPNWSIRSWWDGCLFKRVTATDSTSLSIDGKLKGQLVNIIGVINNGNYAQFGTVTGTCGSRTGDWTVNITAVNNLGSASSGTQTSELTLSAALPPEVVGHSVKIGTDYHYIRAVSGNKITVEMWVDPANTALHVIYGGIARSNGDNANGISFKLLRGFRSAATYSCATTMGVLVSTFGSEYNEIGVIAGAGYDTNSTLSYLDVDQWYSEHNAMDIFDTRSGTTTFEFLRIKNDVGLGLQNWSSNVFKAAAKNNSFVRNKINEKPNVFLGEKWPRLLVGNDGFSESSRYVYIGEMREHIFKNDTQTILLDCTSKKIKNYGRNTLEIVQVGSGLNGGVTRTTLQCYIPFSFRNPSEVNGRAYYLGRTTKPRELKIVVNDDNIIDVYEVNTDAPQLLTDLSLKTGTGVFRFNVASTANLGGNPPTTNGVMRVQLYSADIYVYEAVEELFCYSGSGILTARKLRVKRGDNISAWIDMPLGQLTPIASLPAAAPVADVVTAFNALIADLKAKKFMA